MEQGTNEWLDWRRQGIGASESAAIMGLCPYSTPFQVWQDKLGLTEKFEGNFATQHGQELEAKARARYELVAMEDMPPAIAVHPKYQIMRASLDGLRSDNQLILEIKCPGRANHELALSGKLPDHYMVQVQHQLAVTGADMCHYFSYYDEDQTHALVEVLPDLEMQGRIVSAILDFWLLVETKTPPPLMDRDVKDISDVPEAKFLCEQIKSGKDSLPKHSIDALKASVVLLAGHPKVKCGSVKISSVNRNGKFSYHKLTISEPEAILTNGSCR